MPDLDQLFDTLVADVAETTRPPGAPRAVRRSQRARVMVVALAVAVVAATAGLAVTALGSGDDRTSPAQAPTPSSATTTAEPERPGSTEPVGSFARRLNDALAGAPDWTATGADPDLLEPCAGAWQRTLVGAGGGNIPVEGGTDGAAAWGVNMGFRSPAGAAGAVRLLLDRLAACDVVAWRTAPVPGTGVVLASSSAGVAWIARVGAEVSTLEIGSRDGAPPPEVQVAIADLVRDEID